MHANGTNVGRSPLICVWSFKPKFALVWAGVSLVLSAVVMGLVAFIADHILRG
jgi:hypothetical protein